MSRRARLLTLLVIFSAACGRGEMDYSAALAEAEELFRAQAYEEAFRRFDRLRRQYPDEQAPYRYLAWTADRLGRPGDAVPVLEERAARGGPGVHVVHDLLATLLARLDRRQEAEERYREALRLEPGHGPTYLRLSRLLARSGRYSEALAIAGEGVASAPDDPSLRTWYGEALMKRRRWAEAERELRQALALNGAEAYPRYVLGLVYIHTGRWREARAQLEAATELQPGVAEGWYQLAHACERQGDGDARDRALERFAAVYRQRLASGGSGADRSLRPGGGER